MKNLYKAFLISLSLFAFNATADMYVGGGVYASSVDTGDLDDDDTVPAFFVGWKPVSFLAIEGGYYDLGDYSSTMGPYTDKGDATALTLGVVANIPLWILDVYAKGGLAYVDYEVNGYDDTDTDPYYGVGAAINLGGSIDLYAEYLMFDSKIEVDMFGVGVRFQF